MKAGAQQFLTIGSIRKGDQETGNRRLANIDPLNSCKNFRGPQTRKGVYRGEAKGGGSPTSVRSALLSLIISILSIAPAISRELKGGEKNS